MGGYKRFAGVMTGVKVVLHWRGERYRWRELSVVVREEEGEL
jgi:hypothetical protein